MLLVAWRNCTKFYTKQIVELVYQIFKSSFLNIFWYWITFFSISFLAMQCCLSKLFIFPLKMSFGMLKSYFKFLKNALKQHLSFPPSTKEITALYLVMFDSGNLCFLLLALSCYWHNSCCPRFHGNILGSPHKSMLNRTLHFSHVIMILPEIIFREVNVRVLHLFNTSLHPGFRLIIQK